MCAAESHISKQIHAVALFLCNAYVPCSFLQSLEVAGFLLESHTLRSLARICLSVRNGNLIEYSAFLLTTNVLKLSPSRSPSRCAAILFCPVPMSAGGTSIIFTSSREYYGTHARTPDFRIPRKPQK